LPTGDEFDNIFKKRPFKKDTSSSKSSSKLSNLLKETLRKPNNPYVDYARFDGEVGIYLITACNYNIQYIQY